MSFWRSLMDYLWDGWAMLAMADEVIAAVTAATAPGRED